MDTAYTMQKNEFLGSLEQWYKPAAEKANKRYETGLEDPLVDTLLDYIYFDLLKAAYAGGGRDGMAHECDFNELLGDFLYEYSNNGSFHYEEVTPAGKSIVIETPEDCFDYMYLLGIEGNLYQDIENYLRYADGPYDATLFFAPDAHLDIHDVWSEEQMNDICAWLTEHVLHDKYNLSSCHLFWDNEKVLLIDDNFVDDYEREKLYNALLEWGKDHGFNSLEELDWWFE